jgi:hypothetical protein
MAGSNMATFGEQLRKFRHRCNDPDSPHGKLTQEKFGELMEEEIGIGYTGAALSDWERGKYKIHADNRPLLMALIKVLHDHGGIRTIEEANRLLEAGNYRDLDPAEESRIFPTATSATNAVPPSSEIRASKPLLASFLGNLFSIPEGELQNLIAKAEAGPAPAWPRVVVALIRRFSDRLSVFQSLKFVLWVWVWLLTWWLIAPSLRWPFSSRENAWLGIFAYTVGSLTVPVLIGALTNTSDHEFWRERRDVKNLILRLYTHQGASIGFHVGYFVVFMIGLLLYTFGWHSMPWMELISAAFLVALGYASARLVPYNLFAAFKHLSIKDGWIFFGFVLVGPAWGYFFLETYDILLTRSLGIFIVLSSVTILLAMMALQYRLSGTTVISPRWWIIFWVSFLLCQLLLLWLTQVT